MYKIIFALLFLGFQSLSAQTTLRNQVVPVVGDSFYFQLDTFPENISVGAPGEDLNWDFSKVKAHRRVSEVYRPVSAGQAANSFPNANSVIINQTQERYLKLSRDRVEELGNANRGGFLGGAPTIYASPITIFRTPYAFGSTSNFVTRQSFAISASFLPDSLFAGLPVKPDSLRFQIETSVEREADAWGKLNLPAKTWDVLREKRISTPKVKIEAKIGGFWLDVTAIAGPIFGGLTGGNRPTTSFIFWSNETKGAIAIASVDTLGSVTRLQYKPDDKIVLSNFNELSKVGNISYDADSKMIRIFAGSLKKDKHLLEISDASGKIIESTMISLIPQTENLYQLRIPLVKGIYQISVGNTTERSSKNILIP